jgi:hypothetical protein
MQKDMKPKTESRKHHNEVSDTGIENEASGRF